jgi:5S rRNA maturation endonuclease (ribonuclease M5)
MRRFSPDLLCPVCGGHPKLPQGRGIRCAGFLSDDGGWAHCTREEHAGAIPLDEKTNPPSYAHCLHRQATEREPDPLCRCGKSHGTPKPHSAARVSATAPVTKRTPWSITDRHGAVVGIHERVDRADGSKSFVWRHPDGRRSSEADPMPVSPKEMLYGVAEMLAKDPGAPVVVVEGEKATDALRTLHPNVVVVGTVCGAPHAPSEEALAPLVGRRVYVWPDPDDEGEKQMATVAQRLKTIGAREVKVIRWGERPKDDAADFVARGGTVQQLMSLADASVPLLGEPPVGVLLSDVCPERIDWLWPGRLARRKVTLIDGDPGEGKSALTVDLAARVSRGSRWPDEFPSSAGGVVILTAEDGLADTVRPRLDAAGGDPRRVLAISVVGCGSDERLPTIPDDLQDLERAIHRVGAVLVVVDPLMAYLSADVNSHRDQDVRRALAPLGQLAERTGVAVAVVRHLNKTNGGPAIYRGGGSIGIVGAARIALLVGRDGDDEQRRVLAGVKSNIGPLPRSLAYRLEEAPNGAVRVRWEDGECSLRAADLLALPTDVEERGQLHDAADFLREVLDAGPLAAKEVQRQAAAADIAPRTLRRAREQLGVKPRKVGIGGPWVWALPIGPDPKMTKPWPPSKIAGKPEDDHTQGVDTFPSPWPPSGGADAGTDAAADGIEVGVA